MLLHTAEKNLISSVVYFRFVNDFENDSLKRVVL